MSHWIQIFDSHIDFCSTVTNVRQVDLGCPLDFDKCTAEVLEEWALEQTEKYGDCEVYDKNGTQILKHDSPENNEGYKWAGHL